MKNIENEMLKKKVQDLEDKLMRIESIRMIPQTATLSQVIDIVNKITDNMKRNR